MDRSIGIPKGLWSRIGAIALWRRAAAAGWLIAAMACPAALGDEPVPAWERPGSTSPLAQDIDRQLARDIEHGLSLEQSRVGARSATPLQRYQTGRDVQLSRQNLDTLKTRAPQARPVPLLERKLDRVSRPTGQVSGSRGLEFGYSTSLGLSGSSRPALGGKIALPPAPARIARVGYTGATKSRPMGPCVSSSCPSRTWLDRDIQTEPPGQARR